MTCEIGPDVRSATNTQLSVVSSPGRPAAIPEPNFPQSPTPQRKRFHPICVCSSQSRLVERERLVAYPLKAILASDNCHINRTTDGLGVSLSKLSKNL